MEATLKDKRCNVEPQYLPPTLPDALFPRTKRHLIGRLFRVVADWMMAVAVVALMGVTLYGLTLLVTTYLIADSPHNITRWGWLYIWETEDGPDTRRPLVCDHSPARDVTGRYERFHAISPFTLRNIQVTQLDERRALATAEVVCPYGEWGTVAVPWRAEFSTRLDGGPIGTCIETIAVKTPFADPCPQVPPAFRGAVGSTLAEN